MPFKIYDSQSQLPRSRIARTIGIAAGKGGVGKSLLTANLALAMHQLGLKVGVLDTDLYGPSMRKMLPEDRVPSQKGNLLYPAISHGIQVMSMAYFKKDSESAGIRAPIANRVISQFLQDVVWGELDYLFIDFPPGTGDIQLTLTQQAYLDAVIMITTPQEIALLDVRKAIHLFQQVGVPIMGIVENMSYYSLPHSGEPVFLFGKGGGAKLSAEFGVPLLTSLPIDPMLCQCADKGQSIFGISDPALSPIKNFFTSLASSVQEHAKMFDIDKENFLSHFELVWKEMPS